MSNSENLTGKIALVTGSTSGIGLGIAKALGAAGAAVMMNGLGEDEVIERAREEVAQTGAKTAFSNADLADPEQIAEMFRAVEAELGQVDILVNNAGIQFVSPLQDYPPEKWQKIIAINLSATFYTMRLASRAMLDKGWGRIINIASAHALVASPFKSAYVAAKHGVAGLTKVAALEFAKENITVNSIAPGYVKTPLVLGQVADTAKARGITEEEVVRDVMLAAQPTKRFIEIEEIAQLTLFLCSAGAASITGAVLSVDGGWSAQ